ncbi:hypothetical protein [Saccharopolyspora dendranthemae]|uniref:hypothetical protein n=1 Tax=Saccharopolyspora dendranthemae TaxID=1181886 RepID=UPI0016444D70|nr:hypothetical protein [Saccharopolyspora dendranthemae]
MEQIVDSTGVTQRVPGIGDRSGEVLRAQGTRDPLKIRGSTCEVARGRLVHRTPPI